MPILDIQRRSQEIGRIRIGVKVKLPNGKIRPAKLDSFRFTTRSRHAADAIAATIGGTVNAWEDAPTGDQWEVLTDCTSLPVAVPPGEAALSQWYELWTRGGCQRRCDGVTEQKTQDPCLCPSDPQQRAQEAASGRACKPHTRVNVIIPDLPGLGVWRIESGGYYAAVELGGAAELLAAARAQGVIVPAVLRLEQRKVIADGQTKQFAVPVLDILPTLRELTGLTAGGGIAASLPPAPSGAKALTAAPAPADSPGMPTTPQECAATAQECTNRAALQELGRHARSKGWMDDYVSVNPTDDAAPMEALVEVFRARDEELSQGSAA
jgi:hypothetical protein